MRECYSSPVLVSHRAHGPFGDEGAVLRLDRVIDRHWVVRRPSTVGFVADDRVTAPLGRGLPDGRARLLFVVDGRTWLHGRGGRAVELETGQLALRSRVDAVLERGSGTTLEIDFEGDRCIPDLTHGRLSASACAALFELADATRDAAPSELTRFGSCLRRALDALRAEGLAVVLDPAVAPPAVDAPDQVYMTALDRALSTLGEAPAVVDLEEVLGCDRRTIVRRTRAVHERHALHGLGGTDFRAVRDFYRLLVATILASHERATTEGVARAVGYASPTALCHAFHRVGLPAPSAVRRLAQQ
jgi:AraC-like DNA-binding protein